MFNNVIHVLSLLHTEPLSDERAQEIIDKALESSSLKMRNVIAVLTGLMGFGKTWLLSRLFDQQPPGLYTSTGIAERSYRGLLHHIGNLSLRSWQPFSHGDILDFLASLFRAEIPPANVMHLAARIATIDSSDSAAADHVTPPTQPSTSSSDATPLPTSKSPGLPNASPLTKRSSTGQSMLRLVKAPKSSLCQQLLELVHMIDTGGQPEFMEIMPSLIHNAHLAVLVLNLLFGLDECPPVTFHEKGKAYNRALPSQHTSRQIILKLASTLQSKRFSCKRGQRFRLLVVATHKDCVQADLLEARVKELNRALREILLPACKEELILSSSSGSITYVLNLKDPDSTDLKKLDGIRNEISKSEVGEIIDVPGSFLVFEQDLLKYAGQVDRDILSLNECLQVGTRLKMNGEVVVAALIFFHRQMTFLYFQSVLPNLVFVKPQLPLDFVNAVVQYRYKVQAGEFEGFPEQFVSNLKDGIITEEMLQHKYLSKHFIPNLYEPRHSIELFQHTFTIAPLSREPQVKTSEVVKPTTATAIGRKKREYLMMSLLPAVPDKQLHQRISTTPEIAPLVMKFSKDCVPLSCFSSTISCLLSRYNWRLRTKDDCSPECLAHNIVSLYHPQLPLRIFLVDLTHQLEIHVRVDKGITRDKFHIACFRVRETIFAAVADVFDIMQLTEIHVSPAFQCPCSEVPYHHSAESYQFDTNWLLRCLKTGDGAGAAHEKHTVWLETSTEEKERPSLPKLLRLNLPDKVGASYRNFGIFLLKDETGSRIDAIEMECLGKPDRIIGKILQDWVVGKGEPPIWGTLIKTLRDCKLTVLAEQIQKEL